MSQRKSGDARLVRLIGYGTFISVPPSYPIEFIDPNAHEPHTPHTLAFNCEEDDDIFIHIKTLGRVMAQVVL